MEKEFVNLITNHAGLIYKICNIYCNDPEDKKDMFQEIVLQLWKAFPSFRKEAAAGTWMYRVGLNTAISNYRKTSQGLFKTALSKAVFQVPDPAQLSIEGDNIASLHKAIATLNNIEKAIVMLYLEEKSYEEIAAIIGITKSNVGVKLSRIKSKLEKILKHYKYES